MTPFKVKIIEFVNEYRRILRRFACDETREQSIEKLNLKSKKLRHKTELELYHLGFMILHDIEAWRLNNRESTPEYCGVTQYYESLKEYLSYFRIINQQVVNVCHLVSNSMIHMIQLIQQPSSEKNINHLQHHLNVLKQHTSREERSSLLARLKRCISPHKHDYYPMILNID